MFTIPTAITDKLEKVKKYKGAMKPLVQVVGSGVAMYVCATYIPNSTLAGFSTMVPLAFLSKGIRRVADEIKGWHLPTEHVEGEKKSTNHILLINVDGAIFGDSRQSPLSKMFGMPTLSGFDIEETLRKAVDDDWIRAVVLRFTTPGGTIPAARAIFDGIRHFREKAGRPVIAHIEGLCASGGVYAMVGANMIYAAPGSLIGSIGVTMGTHHWYDQPTALTGGLMGGVETRNGVQTVTLTAGKGKDLLNPWRAPDREEMDLLQRQLDEMYDEFVEHVAWTRGLDQTKIKTTLGAYVFGNGDAYGHGLIDGTKTRREVYEAIADLLELDGYQVVTKKGRGGLLSKLTPSVEASVRSDHQPLGMMALYTGPGSGVRM